MPLAVESLHRRRMKFVLERTSSISCMAVTEEVEIFPTSVYRILTNSWGKEMFVYSGLHMCSMMTKEPCVLFLPLPICSGDRSITVVKVLCYKSEGRWFDPSWCHWNFSLI